MRDSSLRRSVRLTTFTICSTLACGLRNNSVKIDRTCESDRAVLEANPQAPSFWRKVRRCETDELRLAGVLPDVPGRLKGRVEVVRLADGVRLRRFAGLVDILDWYPR